MEIVFAIIAVIGLIVLGLTANKKAAAPKKSSVALKKPVTRFNANPYIGENKVALRNQLYDLEDFCDNANAWTRNDRQKAAWLREAIEN